MDFENTPSSKRLLHFIVQLIIFIICIAFINFIYFENILPDKQVDDDFILTTCQLENKQLTPHGELIERYRADFLLSYVAKGVRYESIASANGLDQSFTTNIKTQEAALQRYTVGQSYRCWYDPEHPMIVVLIERHNWSSTLPLVVPIILALIMLYYLFRHIVAYFEARVRINKQR